MREVAVEIVQELVVGGWVKKERVRIRIFQNRNHKTAPRIGPGIMDH